MLIIVMMRILRKLTIADEGLRVTILFHKWVLGNQKYVKKKEFM